MVFVKSCLKFIATGMVWLSLGIAWCLFVFNYFSKNSLMNNVTSGFIFLVLLIATFDLLRKKKAKKTIV